jgi:hypothetical protein
MSDLGKQLDDLLHAVKTLPQSYQERALVSLRTLVGEWEQRSMQRLDDQEEAAKRRWAELNVEFSRRLTDLRQHIKHKRR